MNQKKFEGYDGKLRLESILKSALAGVGVGAVLAFIFAVVSWFLEFNGLIVAIVGFLVLSAIAGFVFYSTVFHPTVIKNARRLDRYGLDERLVTMVGLDGDDSYIAKKQREDAISALGRLDSSRVRMVVPTVLIALAVVFSVIFVGMGTVEALSEAEIIPSGAEVWNIMFPPEPLDEFTVKYTAGKGGYLIRATENDESFEQKVIEGENAERVLAVAEDGYMFYAWSDGETNPSRLDENVQKDIAVSAVFISVDDLDDEFEDEDEPLDAPGEQQGPGGNMPTEGGGGGKYEEVNQVIDGETYYRDVYEEYYNRAKEYLENGEKIPDELSAVIEAYFNIIK